MVFCYLILVNYLLLSLADLNAFSGRVKIVLCVCGGGGFWIVPSMVPYPAYEKMIMGSYKHTNFVTGISIFFGLLGLTCL